MSVEIVLSIIAIVISVISGGFACYTFIWTAGRDRKQATLVAYNQLQEQALDHLNYYMPAAIKEIAKDRRSEEYKKLSAYVARIEHFCVGVNHKIYDQKTVYELAHGYFDGGLKTRIEPIIERNNQFDHDSYANIHEVYAWMDKETKKRKKKEL